MSLTNHFLSPLPPFHVRRQLAVSLAGPLSFPAFPRVLHRPLLQTLATTTPPTPRGAPAVLQGWLGTPTTVQVDANRVFTPSSAMCDTLAPLSSTRGQRRQRPVPDRGPEEASRGADGRQSPTSRETAQPASDPVPVVALTPKSAAARDQPPRHPLPPQPGRL